jgi:mono/diheme cytochrome c family protein
MTRMGTIAELVVAASIVVAAPAAQAADVKAGEAIYVKQCVFCHGKTGAGDGPAAAKLKEKPVNWTAGALKDLDDAKLAEAIKKGGKAIGKSAAMPPYTKLSEAEVDNVVAYVRSLAK